MEDIYLFRVRMSCKLYSVPDNDYSTIQSPQKKGLNSNINRKISKIQI